MKHRGWPKGKKRKVHDVNAQIQPKITEVPDLDRTVQIIEETPAAPAEQPGDLKVLDKPAESTVLLTREEKMPARVVQDVINLWRQLNGVLLYIEKYLLKAGVKLPKRHEIE